MSETTGLNFDLHMRKAVSLKKRLRSMDVERLSKVLVFYFEHDWPTTVEYAGKIGLKSIRGNPYTETSLRPTLHRFIIRYPEVVRDLYIDYQHKYLRNPVGDAEWLSFVVSFASRRISGKQKFIQWALDNNYYKAGFDIFQNHYNLTDEDRYAFD